MSTGSSGQQLAACEALVVHHMVDYTFDRSDIFDLRMLHAAHKIAVSY